MNIQGVSNAGPLSPQPGADVGASAAESSPLLAATNEMLVSGDAGAAIAALAVQMGHAQKQAAKKARAAAECAEDAAQSAQIDALRDKANLMRVQGVVDGAMSIGGAALDLGSNLSTLNAKGLNDDASGIKSGIKDSTPAMTAAAGRTEVAALQRTADASTKAGHWLHAGHDLDAGVKQVADGLFKGAIADDDTDAQVHEQLATRAKRAVDVAMGEVEDAKKLIEKALDFYKEYTGAKNGAVSAAIHRA